MIDVIEKHALAEVSKLNPQSSAFFMQIQADFWRYIGDAFHQEDERNITQFTISEDARFKAQ